METTPPPERWKRIEDLFDAALALTGAERAKFVDESCGEDTALKAELDSLLVAACDATQSLRGVVHDSIVRYADERTSSLVGKRFGPYRLIEMLGEGGMGVVYLAERDDAEFKRGVAIKILKHGLGSPQAIARFRDERQILAALDHPGIVRLLDGGRTDDGLPYLVMERVDGVPISKHTPRLPVRARIELLLAVCAALQYAHGKLVVHRDIKPSNILVALDGTPKLLDFGIAKLIDPRAAKQLEAHTRTGMALLTPEYASPEQARGEPVSVATDVYSLGAVMYELLAGQPPQRPTGGPLELLETICKIDPPRPSIVAPVELRRELTGDLDNIVMKALHKEPAQRYASIEQLAEDLRRHLDGLPVAARTTTFSYRAGKFARRNRGKLAIAALVAAALSSATVVSIRQARRADAEAERARHRFDEVRRLANSLLFEIDEAIRDVAGTTRARELVVSRALTYLDGLAREAGDAPALARELAIAYMKIGDIQGSPHEPNIGKTADGLRSYEKANALLATLDARDPDVAAARLRATFGTGFMHHTNRDVAKARVSLAAAIDLVKAGAVGIEPITVARAYLALAFIEKEANNIDESLRHTDAGLAYVATWDARTADARYWRAVFLLRSAEVAARAGDPERAATALTEIVAIHGKLSAEFPTVGKYPRERVRSLLLLAMVTGGVGDSLLWVANTNELDRAQAAIRDGLAMIERQAAEDPDNADFKMIVAAFRTSLGLVIAKRAPHDAAPIFEHAFAAYDQLPAAMRQSSYGRENEFIAHCAYAHSLAVLGKPREEVAARAARGLELAAGDPFNVAMCESLVGRAWHAFGDHALAIKHLDAVVATLRPMTSKPDTAALIGFVDTVEHLTALRPEAACTLRREALERWTARPAKTAYLSERRQRLAAAVASCSR